MTDTTSSPVSKDGGSLADEAKALARNAAQLLPRELLRARDIATGRMAEESSTPPAYLAEQAQILVQQALVTAPADLADAITLASGSPAPVGILAAKALTLMSTISEEEGAIAGAVLELLGDLIVLPLEIATEAVILAGELTLPASAALRAFTALTQQRYAVYGVERWLRTDKRDNVVEWLGTSDYEPECNRTSADWPTYVQCCLQGALAFVESGAVVRGALFNYTWGWEGEREELTKSIR